MNHQDQIRPLLDTYERSLNTSDAELAASLHPGDAVFMPTTLPTATGAHMRQAYEQIFAAIGLEVTFTIDELAIAGDNTAYARTRSSGTQLNRATGETLSGPPGDAAQPRVGAAQGSVFEPLERIGFEGMVVGV